MAHLNPRGFPQRRVDPLSHPTQAPAFRPVWHIPSYLGQLAFVLAESEMPGVEVNVADACPQEVDSLGVLTEKVAPLAPPPPVAVELLTDQCHRRV